MIRSLIARGMAALALTSLALASPALADITVKDGTGGTQNVGAATFNGKQFYGMAPINTLGQYVDPATDTTLKSLLGGFLPQTGSPTAGVRSYDSTGTGITSTAGNAGHTGLDVNVLNPAAASSSSASSYFAETTTPIAASATFTGTTRDAGASPSLWAYFGCYATADQASASGGLKAQTSPDGTTWTTFSAGTLAAGGIASAVAPVDRFDRCVLVNGATAEGSVTVKSRFTIAAAN